MDTRILTHYALYKFKDSYWSMPGEDRGQFLDSFTKSAQNYSEATWFFQVYPTSAEWDIMIWSNIHADELQAPAQFMEVQARFSNLYRPHIEQKLNFWGITKPSVYSKAKRSAQELDPFGKERRTYFVIYPFSKTTEWYLKTREERQEMMNGHITIGKKYTEINQLLLYSFGMQDQEFVVAYEMENLPLFSDLVYELRSTEARLYTLSDTPIITCIHHEREKLVEIFSWPT